MSNMKNATFVLMIVVGFVPFSAKADCDAGKALLCSVPIASCGVTAGFGGREPLYRCVAAGASWCLECLGFSDPRDPNTDEGGGAGVSCTGSKCGFSNLQSALTVGQAQPFGSSAIAANQDGHLELVAAGPGAVPFHIWQDGPASTWNSEFASFPGAPPAQGRPMMVRGTDGRLSVFYASKQGQLVRIRQAAPNVNWTAPEMIGPVDGIPAVSNSDSGEAAIVWVNGNHALKVVYLEEAASSFKAAPLTITTGVVGVPALGRNQDGRVEAVARTTDGSYIHAWQTSATGWNSASFGGQFSLDPQINRNYDGRLEVFGTNKLGDLLNVWQVAPNGDWSGWNEFPGTHQYTVASVIQTNGMLSVFAIGVADRALYQMSQLPAGGWGNWSPLGGKIVAAPRAALNPTAHWKCLRSVTISQSGGSDKSIPTQPTGLTGSG